MLHKMGYDYYCADCEKPCRDEDIADHENGVCEACADAWEKEQMEYWRPLYKGEKQAGLLEKGEDNGI